MAERGVVRLQQSGQYLIAQPRQFVGSARRRGLLVRILPRWPRLYEVVRRRVNPALKRVGARVAEHDPEAQSADAISAFIAALETVVINGFPFAYESKRLLSSRPSGRIRFSESVRLLESRGISHMVYTDKTMRRSDPDVACLASTVTSLLVGAGDLTSAELTRAHKSLDAIDATQMKTPAEVLALALNLVDSHPRPDVVDLAASAASILQGETLLWQTWKSADGGQHTFCDMDTAWELALANSLRGRSWLAGGTVQLHPFASSGFRVPVPNGAEIDPDVIVQPHSGRPIVIEAKYQEAARAAASDLYQVLAYVDRLGAAVGILVYVSAKEFWSTDVGTTGGGGKIWACGIATDATESSLERYAALVAASAQQTGLERKGRLGRTPGS